MWSIQSVGFDDKCSHIVVRSKKLYSAPFNLFYLVSCITSSLPFEGGGSLSVGLFFFQLPEPFVSQLPVGAILLPVQSSCTGSRTFNESRKHHKLNYFWGGGL